MSVAPRRQADPPECRSRSQFALLAWSGCRWRDRCPTTGEITDVPSPTRSRCRAPSGRVNLGPSVKTS